MKKRLNKIAIAVFVTSLFLHSINYNVSWAKDKTIKIEVLAERSIVHCLEKWVPTAEYLTRKIPGYNFGIVPFDYNAICPVFKQGKMDFIIINPALYVELEMRYDASRISTLKILSPKGVLKEYGGVIFCRTDNTSIQQIKDLNGKTFMAPNEKSFGGWHAVWKELKDHDIDPYNDFTNLQFIGSHDEVVYAVRDGKVDAGSIRTNTLERMEIEGKININDFKVLPYNYLEKEHYNLPTLQSTKLYPEWLLAKAKHTDNELAEKVVSALLNMSTEDPAAKAAKSAGWTIPHNYQPVHECLKELKVVPYENLGKISAVDALREYWQWLSALLLLLLSVTTAGIFILRLNRHINASHLRLQEEITERKQAEHEIKLVNTQLEDAISRANQLALDAESASIAKSRFLATMSHEIRTPMNGVIGFTDMLLDTELNEDQVDYAKTIKRSGEALLGLINDVLDFSKIEAGQMELESIPFDPEVTAYDVCELIRPRVGNRPVEILCRINDEVPAYIEGDPSRYRQVLINLIGNSAKFTESGEIELSLYIEEEEKNRIKLHSMIRDTGIGIAKEKLESIFRPFEQADGSTTRKYGGTGLGLSICKQISNLMQGDVWVESTVSTLPNQGSIFHFTAWFKKSDEKPPTTIIPVSLKEIKVLIADDNITNLDILVHTLESAGMEPVAVSDARYVEDTLKKQPFDIGILDIQMPYINGYDLAKKIKKSSQIPLLAFSSSTERGAKKCLEAGFNGFLSKPIRRKKLLNMIERLLREEKYTPSEKKEIVTQYSIREEKKHSVSILLAEDNPVNQKLAKVMLTKAGYQVEVANNGKEAVQKYKENTKAFDLIFMDIQMPEMDGMQATKKIRRIENRNLSERSGDPALSEEETEKLDKTKNSAKSNHIIIIAMTANAFTEDRERCIESGMDDYMPKPIKREIVFGMIDRWVIREREGER